MPKSGFGKPEDCSEVLLHACCAPCSSAIVEWLMANGVRPTIYYYNPNIWPREEYEIRKNESKRHAEGLGITWIDGDYEHERWLEFVRTPVPPINPPAPPINTEYDVAAEPERGRRCEECFRLRLTATARKAQELGIGWFATTLASSRWKSLEQIERAGRAAEQAVEGVLFWAQNWRKGGLQERRNELLREYGFYNQQYCGCEFSAHGVPTKTVLRQQMREAKRQHEGLLARMSAEIVERLAARIDELPSPSTIHHPPSTILAYWPLKDEVDIRPLLDRWVAEGRTVVLPKVLDDERMELRRYTGRDDLREGAYGIMEPVGEPFTQFDEIGVALVPGMAFDAAGRRLGRGKGYYDRFLSQLAGGHIGGGHKGDGSPVSCPRHSENRPREAQENRPREALILGVCFPFQRVPVVPAEAHDVVMDEVIS